VVEL
jgi:hypothetical protein